nr:hypothetical protein [Tanacetum cinerariifolium]GEV97450.1 hypothetical protein [Tanacetum cinerariifolium]
MILELVEHCPVIWPTVEENGMTRTKKYAELSTAEKIQADCDIKATNIILHGLSADIYLLANHHRVAKDLWERVQLLMQESPLADSGFAVLVFSPRDYPIACLNKAMTFLTAVASSRFPLTNNQLITSLNPRNQATIQDGRVTVKQVQGRLDPGVLDGQAVQTIIPNNVAFQTKDLHIYDYDVMISRMQKRFSWPTFPTMVLMLSQSKPYDALPVKIEAPKELPMISLVNESLKKLKSHLAKFDNVLQDKDSTICKLKDIINSLREKSKEENINYDYGDIETKNVELKNSVAKLSSKNERLCNEINHVKQEFNSIKKTCVRTKEHNDSLIDKLNLKSAENEDLKSQIQDKVFMMTSLKNDLRKLKGKEIVDIAAQTPSAYTIVPGMFKLDLKSLAPRNMKNKVEAQPRNVNKKNHVVEPILNVGVKHSLLKANSEPICATCKKSMFDGVHDMCHLDFMKNVNSRAKSSKKHKKQNIWKPTGHVFTEVGFKWKPSCRTFTIVGNSCPLPRITSANLVPPKKPTTHSAEPQKPELKVYNKKPKNIKNVGSSKKFKIVESMNANHSKPNHTWGSNAIDIPSSSSLVMIVRFENNHIARIMGSKYEAPKAIIKCIKNIQVHLNATACNVRTYNRTEFVNQTLREFHENVGISHQTSVACTPQQNGVFERRNQTLVEAARTIYDWDHLFQHMFDEYFNPPTMVVSPVQEATASRTMDLADSPVSTSIDKDAPLTSIPSLQEQEHL